MGPAVFYGMQEIQSFIEHSTSGKLNSAALKIEKLFGQASARQYFRATWSGNSYDSHQGRHASLVVMKLPGGFSSPAEEVTKMAPGAPVELPFLNVQRYLGSIGVKVPEVIAIDKDKGMVLLEDLGDRTLESLVKEAEGEFFVFYYKKVLDELVELQVKTAENPLGDCVAGYRNFSEDLLNWEFDHFLEFGIEDRFGIKIADDRRSVWNAKTRDVSRKISAMPQGFVHRDFQSRNLMFKNYDFYLIDFQDALTGPLLYDLVGLLRDSYIEFTPDQLHQLLEYYYSRLPKEHPYAGKLADMKRDFHLISLQRKLKDTGRFQYIKTVKNNPGFLPHVPLSLQYVRQAFASLPEYDDLRLWIAEYVGELR